MICSVSPKPPRKRWRDASTAATTVMPMVAARERKPASKSTGFASYARRIALVALLSPGTTRRPGGAGRPAFRAIGAPVRWMPWDGDGLGRPEAVLVWVVMAWVGLV